MRVLFLTHRLPYAPNRGDRTRAYHIIQSLASRTELEVVSFVHDADEAAQADRARALGVRVSIFEVPRWLNRMKAIPQLAGHRPLTHMLLDAPGFVARLRQITAERPPDVVLAYCSGMARFAVIPPLSQFPLVVDFVDVDSAKWEALAEHSSWPMRWIYRREARVLGPFEGEAALRARHSVVVNHREARLLKSLAPSAKVSVLPVGVSLHDLRPAGPPAAAPELVFCGVMNYAPNVEGVLWFAREVWPLVRRAQPDAHFSIVGSDPLESVRHLAKPDAGITVTGTVPDVRPHLWRAALSVAPLKTARGVQNKVLEALASGLPTVVTTPVAGGLPDTAIAGCRIADAAEAFASEILTLLARSPAERREIAERPNLESLAWERQLEPLYRICLEAASPSHAPQVNTATAPR